MAKGKPVTFVNWKTVTGAILVGLSTTMQGARIIERWPGGGVYLTPEGLAYLTFLVSGLILVTWGTVPYYWKKYKGEI